MTDTLPNGADDQPQIGLLAQYVKDLSFENPNSPAVYSWQVQPNIDIQFNIGSEKAADDVHEVSIKITAKAVADEGTVYAVELVYGGLFGLRNIAEDQVRAFLYAEAPRLMFPFARRVLADAVRDGGFAPLMLDPIDFAGLYAQQVQAQMAGGQGAVAGEA